MADRTFAATERVAAREVDEELILLDLEDGTFFVSKGVGPRVWELLAGGNVVSAIVETVASRYDMEVARVQEDVNNFIELLLERGFIQEST